MLVWFECSFAAGSDYAVAAAHAAADHQPFFAAQLDEVPRPCQHFLRTATHAAKAHTRQHYEGMHHCNAIVQDYTLHRSRRRSKDVADASADVRDAKGLTKDIT